jgi:hypothetical protein
MMPHQTITADAVASTINAALLRETLARIEANPAEWNQRTYAACFANHAARLAGGQALDPNGMLWAAEKGEPSLVARDGARVVTVHDRAKRELGLDGDQAYDLFHGENDLDSLREVVGELIAEIRHVTIRFVAENELTPGEALDDGRLPLAVVEHRPGQPPMFHGGESGIAPRRLRQHAGVVATRYGIPYVDPIDPAAMERLTRAEAA